MSVALSSTSLTFDHKLPNVTSLEFDDWCEAKPLEERSERLFDHEKDVDLKKIKEPKQAGKFASKKVYLDQLLKEYDNILLQAKVSFWLWVTSFVFCYLIVAITVILIIKGQYIEALTTVVLESLVYAVQRLFAIREDHYRDLINMKIRHLEVGDYLDYAFEKMSYTDDIEIRNMGVSKIIDSIRALS